MFAFLLENHMYAHYLYVFVFCEPLTSHVDAIWPKHTYQGVRVVR